MESGSLMPDDESMLGAGQIHGHPLGRWNIARDDRFDLCRGTVHSLALTRDDYELKRWGALMAKKNGQSVIVCATVCHSNFNFKGSK